MRKKSCQPQGWGCISSAEVNNPQVGSPPIYIEPQREGALNDAPPTSPHGWGGSPPGPRVRPCLVLCGIAWEPPRGSQAHQAHQWPLAQRAADHYHTEGERVPSRSSPECSHFENPEKKWTWQLSLRWRHLWHGDSRCHAMRRRAPPGNLHWAAFTVPSDLIATGITFSNTLNWLLSGITLSGEE